MAGDLHENLEAAENLEVDPPENQVGASLVAFRL